MPSETTLDDAVLHQLPLPLAQLYRRAHNAHNPTEAHQAAFYAFEVALKLLGATAVVEYAERTDPDPAITSRLEALARPALGHWWEFARLLLPVLATADTGFATLAGFVLSDTRRDDVPALAGLSALLRTETGHSPGAKSTVVLRDLFDQVITYRNVTIGHGAIGMKGDRRYERVARAMRAGLTELFGKVDVLAGRRLMYVGELAQSQGVWLVPRWELVGPNPRRVATLEVPRGQEAGLPDGRRVYLSADGDALRLMHPLVDFDPESESFYLFNSVKGKRDGDFLCYPTGETRRVDVRDRRGLLGRVMDRPVADADVRAWEDAADAADVTPLPQAVCERHLGDFELISELGRGGMGVVYRAWQPSLRREVAVKEIRDLGEKQAHARFVREIRAHGKVDHPHVVKVFASGSDGERQFFAMELLDGVSLGHVLELIGRDETLREVNPNTWSKAVSSACDQVRQAEKPLSNPPPAVPPPVPPTDTPPPSRRPRRALRGYIAQVAELVRQTAVAAHALHEAGIVHRDIKPGNIQVSPDGTHATLMDLGLAHLAEDEGKITRTRQVLGTPQYASPQQVMAMGKADRRDDVYSLGATLWELLTLRPMFDADARTPLPQLFERIQREDPADPRSVQPDVPKELAVICLKCLHKDAPGRYQTAREVAEEIERWQQNRPILARPSTGLERASMWVRRNPLLTALFATALVGAAFSTWQWVRAEGEATQAKANAKLANDEKTRADGEAAAAKRQAAVATDGKNAVLLDNAYQACVRNDLPTAERLLARLKPAERDNPEGRYVESLIRRKAGPTFGAEPGLEPVRIQTSADGRVLAAEYRSAERTTIVGGDGGEGGFGKLTVFRTADRSPLLAIPRGGEHSQYQVSKDGTRVVSMRNDDTACLWDADTGRKVGEWAVQSKGETEAGSRVVLTPDGKWFVTCTADGVIERRDLRTGERTHRVETGRRFDRRWGERVRFLRRLPVEDELTLEAATADGTLVRVYSPVGDLLFDLTTGQAVDSPTRPASGRFTPVFATADGPSEASGHVNDDESRVELHTRGGFGRRWSHAGGLFAVSLPHDASSYRHTPDGRHLSILSGAGVCLTWDLRTGQPVARVELPSGGPTGLHARGVSVLHTDPDDPRAAVVELFDVRSGHRLRKDILRLRADLPADASPPPTPAECSWHPGGRYAVFCYAEPLKGFEGKDTPGFEIWDLDARRCTRPFTPTDGPATVHFSPGSDRVLIASRSGCRVYSAADGKPAATLPRRDTLLDWGLSPDGTRLSTCHADGGGHLWDVAAGTRVATFDPRDFGAERRDTPQYCLDGERFVALRGVNTGAATPPRLVFWDTRTGEPAGEISVSDTQPVQTPLAAVAGGAPFIYPPRLPSTFELAPEDPLAPYLFGFVPQFRLTPDGRRLVLLTRSWVQVYEVKTARRLLELRRDPAFDALNTSSGGEAVFGRPPADPTADPVVYDTRDLQRVAVLEATPKDERITAVVANPDGKGWWVIAVEDRRLVDDYRLVAVRPARKRDIGEEGERDTSHIKLPAMVLDLRFADGRVLARSAVGVTSWDLSAGKSPVAVSSLIPPFGDIPDGVSQTTDRDWVAEAHRLRATVVVNRLAEGFKPHVLPVRATALGWVGDGRLVVGHADGLTVWHLDAVGEAFTDRREPSDDWRDSVFGAGWVGRRAVAGRIGWTLDGYDVAADGHVRRVQSVDGKLLKDDKVRGHIGEVFGVAASPDGKRFATSSFDGSVQVWDAATTTPLFQVSDAQDLRGTYRYAVAFHPSGRWLLASRNAKPSDGTEDVTTPRPQEVVVYDADTGKQSRTLRGHEDVIWQIAFDATGERLITCGQDNLIRVWDFASGDEQFHMSGHTDWVLTAKFTPDGTKVVSGGRDNVMKVWDVATRRSVEECEHPSSVTKVCLTADGSRAITACGDGQVRFWNLHTGQAKLTLNASKKPLWAMDLSRDETRLLTGGEDGALRVWVFDHPSRRDRPPESSDPKLTDQK